MDYLRAVLNDVAATGELVILTGNLKYIRGTRT
jgi:hypothetical protein